MRFILFLIFTFCASMDNNYIDVRSFNGRILNSCERNGFFLRINIKSKDSISHTYVIENYCMFNYMNKFHGMDKKKYLQVFNELLIKDSSIYINDFDNIFLTDFVKVEEIYSVNDVYGNGIDSFIDKYFHGQVLKSGLSVKEVAAVIDKLFINKIACYVDDETGFLVYSR